MSSSSSPNIIDSTDRPRATRFQISVDWAALLVALVVAGFIRFGIIGRVPW